MKSFNQVIQTSLARKTPPMFMFALLDRHRWLLLASGLMLHPAAASAQQAPAASGHGGVPAMYATQAEAEKAARLHFNCTGAHRMGIQWMPCSLHGAAKSGAAPVSGSSH